MSHKAPSHLSQDTTSAAKLDLHKLAATTEHGTSEPARRAFRFVATDTFDARRGYRRCSPPGVGVSWQDGPHADADFWNDRTGRLFVRFTSQGYVLHLEVTHNDGTKLSDEDMDGFEADAVELLNEWLAEGVDDLPSSCHDQDDLEPEN